MDNLWSGLQQAVNQFTNVGYVNAAPIYLPADHGLTIWAFGMLLTFKALGNETGGSYSLMEGYVRPGQGPLEHKHAGEDEFWRVLDGTLVFHVANETHEAPTGSFLHIPRGVPHFFENKSPSPARMLAMHSPGGLEQWFIDVGKPYESMDKEPKFSEEEMQQALVKASKYGIEHSPPPAASA